MKQLLSKITFYQIWTYEKKTQWRLIKQAKNILSGGLVCELKLFDRIYDQN